MNHKRIMNELRNSYKKINQIEQVIYTIPIERISYKNKNMKKNFMLTDKAIYTITHKPDGKRT